MNKLLRNQLKKKKYFKRLRRLASWGYWIRDENGIHRRAKWFELVGLDGCNVYRTTGTPCSCPLCSYGKYNRKEFKKQTKRVLKENLLNWSPSEGWSQ